MVHDFNGAPPQNFSDLDKQPLNNTHPTKNTTQFSASMTHISLDFKSPTAIDDITSKIKGDFWGDSGASGNFRFRHTYFGINSWLFGQTSSAFVSTEMNPDTVDWNTLQRGSLRRRPQIRYTETFDANNSLAAALESSTRNKRFPALTAKI